MAAFRPGQVIDLTHRLSPGFPHYPGDEPPLVAEACAIATDGFRTRRWQLDEHSGTHLDAPAHMVPDGLTVDQLPAAGLVAPLAVVRFATAPTPDAALSLADLRADEDQHGPITPGSAVLVNTGWHHRAGGAAYLGLDAAGGLHFPGCAAESARWLVDARDVVGIGIDTLSLDAGCAVELTAHQIVLGAGRWIVENATGLDTVPPRGAVLVVGLPRLAGGTGAPVRLLALV